MSGLSSGGGAVAEWVTTFLTLRELCYVSRTHHAAAASFIDCLGLWVCAHKERVSGVWESGWMRAVTVLRAVHPPSLRSLGLRAHVLHSIMECLAPHTLTGYNAVCGSFALHMAEHTIGRCRPQWTPNDIDFFITQPEGNALVCSVLCSLIENHHHVSLIDRCHHTSTGNDRDTAGVYQRVMSRHIHTANAFFRQQKACGVETAECTRAKVRTLVDNLTTVDSYYQFHLLDVLVDDTVMLSFIVNENCVIDDLMGGFDISVCQVALSAGPSGFEARMKPWVREDICKKRCCGAPNTFCTNRHKVNERLKKYARRGYAVVQSRCLCNKRCKGDYTQCVCIGHFHSNEGCDCASGECCKQKIYRPAPQRYYNYQPPTRSPHTRKRCGHDCEREGKVCCQCVDTRDVPGEAPSNHEPTNTIHQWVNHTQHYCKRCKWDYTL